MTIYATLYKNETPIGKTTEASAADKPIWKADAAKIAVDNFLHFAQLLSQLDTTNAISAGFFKPEFGTAQKVVSARGKVECPEGINRSDSTMIWSDGPGLCILDIDLKSHRSKGYLTGIDTEEQVNALLVKLMPELANVGLLIRASSSSHLYQDGKLVEFIHGDIRETSNPLSGVHVYFMISQGSKAPAVIDQINARAEQLFEIPGLCDRAIARPSAIVYVGGRILTKSFTQDKTAIDKAALHREGGELDTTYITVSGINDQRTDLPSPDMGRLDSWEERLYAAAEQFHPIVLRLQQLGMIRGRQYDSGNRFAYTIRCPWEHEHTTPGGHGTFFRFWQGTDKHQNDMFWCSHESCRKANRNVGLHHLTGMLEADAKSFPKYEPGYWIKRVWDMQYLIVTDEEKVVDLELLKKGDGLEEAAQTIKGFKLANAKYTVKKGDKGDTMPVTSLFFHDGPKCAKVTFDPQEGPITRRNFLNPFGYHTWPATSSIPSTFLEFTEYLFPDVEQREYMLDWCAHKVQKPAVLQPLVLMSSPGVYGSGKDLFARAIMALWGSYGLKKEFKSVFDPDNRNAGMAFSGNILTYCPEVAPDNRKTRGDAGLVYNKIKQLTSPGEVGSKMAMENKYAAERIIQLSTDYLMSTNHERPFSIPEDDRRITVVGVTPNPLPHGDPYYAKVAEAIVKQQPDLWWWFKRRDLRNYNPGQPIHTPEKEALYNISQDPDAVHSESFVEKLEKVPGIFATKSQLEQWDISEDRYYGEINRLRKPFGTRAENINHRPKYKGVSLMPYLIRPSMYQELKKRFPCKTHEEIKSYKVFIMAELAKSNRPGFEEIANPKWATGESDD